MNLKNILINIVAISVIFILPHSELIPNFGYTIPLLLFAWLLLKYNKETFADIGFSFKRYKSKSILIGVIVAVLTVSFMQLIFFPTLGYFVTIEETDVGLYDFIKAGQWQYIFIVLMGWLVGGFYEEILFHGFIFSRLEKMIPSKYSTALAFTITSVIFGVYHFQLGADGLINAFIVGAVYLSLFLFFGRNLWYSIICHGLYNTIVVTMIYYGYL